jgi:hypothetical protein
LVYGADRYPHVVSQDPAELPLVDEVLYVFHARSIVYASYIVKRCMKLGLEPDIAGSISAPWLGVQR